MKRKSRSSRQSLANVRSAVLVGLMFCFGPAVAQQPELPTIALNADIFVIQAEVADTPATRELGLMRRKSMAQGAGMLFLFDESATHCMWMKNTLIPLSVAFITTDGRIVNLADMQPQTEDVHCGQTDVRYALETPLHWFAQHGIRPGARVLGLPAPSR